MLAAIYCRLSREDEDKNKECHEKLSESESIQNQKSMLLKYAADKNWDVYDIYCDDDYSGADRNRPAFNKMLQEAEEGKFDIILVKTQSRFTRDMELVEKYIHGLFVEWGIRFVAAVDHTDTDVKGTKKARQISGLINEWYLEDLSENIRAVFDNKRKQGQCISGCTPYGYLFDNTPERNFIIDEEAAAVVRRIFTLYLEGNGTPKIARILNNERVPNPTKHKQELGMKFRNGCQNDDYGLWNTTTLRRMLRDSSYIGDLVQGKSRSKSYKTRETAPIPKEKWMIAPNRHEPIVDQDVFWAIQEMLAARSKTNHQGEIHPLAGKTFCADCKSTLHKYNNSKGNGKSINYMRCKLYAKHHALCTLHSIRLDVLEDLVLSRIKNHLQELYHPMKNVPQIDAQKRQQEKERKSEIARLERAISLHAKAIKELYLDKARGVIDATQFSELNRNYLAEKQNLEQHLMQATQAAPNQENKKEIEIKLQVQMREIENVNHLTRELVAMLIQRIEVGEKQGFNQQQNVTIEWNF